LDSSDDPRFYDLRVQKLNVAVGGDTHDCRLSGNHLVHGVTTMATCTIQTQKNPMGDSEAYNNRRFHDGSLGMFRLPA